MRRGPRPAPVTLTEDERQALTSLAHRSRTAPQLARRARIILACADGQATRGIAKRLHLSATTVCKWRTRFLADRIDGLTDEPRPGAPRRITDAQVEDVVVRTLTAQEDLIDFRAIDRGKLPEWIGELEEARRRLGRLIRRLKQEVGDENGNDET